MEKAFIKPYEQGWASKPAENSWVTPQIMDNYDQAIDEIDNRVIGINEDLTQIYDDGFASRNIANINEIMIGRGWDERVAENRATLFVPIEPNVQYTISAKASTISRFQNFTLREMKTHNALGSEGYGQNLTSSNPTVSRTSGSDIHFLSIQLELASGIFTSDKLDGINLQVEYGTEATPYTPYAPSNIELMENLTQLNIATTKAITTNVTSAYGSIGYASFTQIGNTKKIYAEINVSSQLSAWGVVCTLPTEARPSATQTLSISVGANRYRGFLNTDGTITTSSPITSGQTVVLENIYI